MHLLDRIAARFGYVKAPVLEVQSVKALPAEKDVEAPAKMKATSDQALQPGDFGLPPNVTFRVTRGGQISSRPVTWTEALDFLGACGVDFNIFSGEMSLADIFAGVPFHIDGADMSLTPILFLPDGTRRWPDDGSEWVR